MGHTGWVSRKPQQGEGSGHQGIPSFSPASSGPLSSYESPRGYTHSLGDMLHTETGMRGPSLSTFAKDWGAGYSGTALERPLFTAMAPHSTWKLALFKEALSFLNIGFLCAHMSSWLCTCSPHPPNHTHWGLRPQCPSSLPSTETPVLLTCVLWQPLRAWAETCQCGQWPGPKGSQGTSLTRGQQRDNGDHVSRS